MLQEPEIVELIKKVLKAKVPDWKKNYMENICKNLQVHTKGLLFKKVDTLFPHEHPDSKAHCINTYEPITKGSIGKGINNISRIFCNSSFSVSASDSTLNAINADMFDGKNLFSYFVPAWIDANLATDPNSLCAVYPDEYLAEYPGSKVRFIGSQHRVKTSPEMVVFISEEESEKKYNIDDTVIKSEVFYDANIDSINSKRIVEKTYNQRVVCEIIKSVYHVFTQEYIFRFTELGNSEYDYQVFPYKNKIGIPAFPLTSPSLQYDIQESFLSAFLPFGNLALLQHRNHRAVDLMFSYPRMSEIQSPCDNQICSEGIVHAEDGDHACSRCGGSGYITVQSPYKVYQKKLDTGLSDPDAIKATLAAAPVSFHTPDVSILDYSKNSWKDYLAMAEEAIFVQQKQKTGNVESAKSKELDKEAEYAFTQKIAKALNTDLQRVIQAFEDFENSNPVEVSVEMPISLAIVSEAEAFEALSIIIGSEAPVFVKAQQVENYLHRYVSKSSPLVKAVSVLKRIDKLLFYSNKDVQTFKSNNVIDNEAYSIHVFAYSTLMQLYEADKKLFLEDENVIADKVLKAIPKMQPTDLKKALLDEV